MNRSAFLSPQATYEKERDAVKVEKNSGGPTERPKKRVWEYSSGITDRDTVKFTRHGKPVVHVVASSSETNGSAAVSDAEKLKETPVGQPSKANEHSESDKKEREKMVEQSEERSRSSTKHIHSDGWHLPQR